MKILKSAKGVANKYRGFALGTLATIVAIGSILFYYQSADKGALTSSSPASSPDPVEVGQAAAHDVKTCGHDHSQDQLPKAKQVTLDRSARMLDSKLGDQLELSFGEELELRGEVAAVKNVSEGRKAVTMKLLGQKGSVYWLEDAQGGVIGNVILTKNGENQVYKFTGRDDQWFLQEIPFQDYICSSDVTDDSVGMPASAAPFTPAGASAIIPLLNSRPSAEAVIYIDFDGEVVSGTRWVSGGTINAEESGHTEAEIRAIWSEVSEDMRPFHINVTTDRAVFDAAPQNRKMHVIVTPTTDAAPGAGGVAYLNSFYDGTVGPCWCFNLGMGSAGKTISHEVGHTFGLRHDGLDEQEYHPGNGTWGPIMGAPFGHSVVSWSMGGYTGSTNTEDDLAMITSLSTNGFGYREDAYGDSNAEAFSLEGESGETAVNITSVIETTQDVDVFTFRTSGGLTALSVGHTVELPIVNMNIQLTLYDEVGNVVEVNEDPGYEARLSKTLTAGIYFLHIEGIADGTSETNGFNDYGSLGEYVLSGDIEG